MPALYRIFRIPSWHSGFSNVQVTDPTGSTLTPRRPLAGVARPASATSRSSHSPARQVLQSPTNSHSHANRGARPAAISVLPSRHAVLQEIGEVHVAHPLGPRWRSL